MTGPDLSRDNATAQPQEKEPTCRVEMVDGEPVRVMGDGRKWTDQDRSAFAQVVRAAKRAMEDDRG